MSNSTSVSFPTNPGDDRPLPMIVAERWGFPLQRHFVDGQWWYAIQDWIVGLTAENIDKVRKVWAKMQSADIFSETSTSSRHLDYIASDGKTYYINQLKLEGWPPFKQGA